MSCICTSWYDCEQILGHQVSPLLPCSSWKSLSYFTRMIWRGLTLPQIESGEKADCFALLLEEFADFTGLKVFTLLGAANRDCPNRKKMGCMVVALTVGVLTLGHICAANAQTNEWAWDGRHRSG